MAMSDIHAIEGLILEAAPVAVSALEIVRSEDPLFWVARFEHVDVVIEFEAPVGRLVFSSEIGAPADARRLEVLEAALLYDRLGAETGGVRLTLEERGGPLIQMFEIELARLDATKLARILDGLNTRTMIWRRYVTGEDPDAPNADDIDPSFIKLQA